MNAFYEGFLTFLRERVKKMHFQVGSMAQYLREMTMTHFLLTFVKSFKFCQVRIFLFDDFLDCFLREKEIRYNFR